MERGRLGRKLTQAQVFVRPKFQFIFRMLEASLNYCSETCWWCRPANASVNKRMRIRVWRVVDGPGIRCRASVKCALGAGIGCKVAYTRCPFSEGCFRARGARRRAIRQRTEAHSCRSTERQGCGGLNRSRHCIVVVAIGHDVDGGIVAVPGWAGSATWRTNTAPSVVVGQRYLGQSVGPIVVPGIDRFVGPSNVTSGLTETRITVPSGGGSTVSI